MNHRPSDDPHGDPDPFVGNALRISCADAIELVTGYLDSSLDDADLQAFEEHTSLCEACQVYIDQVRRTIRITAAERDASVEVRPRDFPSLLELFAQQHPRAGDDSASSDQDGSAP
ncbi:zf-HC2 domain-containing protein [Lolliginicoccus suaedae]|uniref:zf-HC2 domain-containing protein n=1 Tax=Lolliginicoccus suaedae TaxID=2605429 RepID=UPI001F440F10|nr:zf-HC2 domain-containing protein [Lolliginicoccus suaedae]